ncbi:MAG TPA: protoporphyrinogen oxidase HemJ [Geminicoccaceae bacterium]|nr:protoporphyrinogen oxidase HemJ [Geminicoccaceae bacterium]
MTDPGLWLLAIHVVAFTAWMAAMWYLPRLFVYHSGAPVGSEASETFKVMERRLLRVIATPAMVVAILAGVTLGFVGGYWTGAGWLHAKTVLVLLLAACHGLTARYVRAFGADARPKSARWFRAFNELPTVLFVAIVLLAVFRPF